jgi:hypothetical protein
MQTGNKSTLKSALLLVVAVAVGLLLGEGAVRAAIQILHHPPLFVGDPRTGWIGRPNFDDETIVVARGRFRVTTDSLGHRVMPVTTAVDNRPTVVLVGDSFVYGLNVDDHDTFAWQLSQQIPSRRFINLGAPGWGPCQEWLSLDRYFAQSRDSTVRDVVVMVYENDFLDVQRWVDPWLGRRRPMFHVVGNRLIGDEFHLTTMERLMDRSRLAWLIRSKLALLAKHSDIDPRRGTDVVLACLGKMRNEIESHGARPVILAHQRIGHPPILGADGWTKFLAASGAMDITDSIRAGSRSNPLGFDKIHWSKEGNRRAAEVVRNNLLSMRE